MLLSHIPLLQYVSHVHYVWTMYFVPLNKATNYSNNPHDDALATLRAMAAKPVGKGRGCQ